MRKKLTTTSGIVVAPWKFFLLAATLLFSYAIPVHADDHEAAPEEAAAAEIAGIDMIICGVDKFF